MSEFFNKLVAEIEKNQIDHEILIRVGYGASGQAAGSLEIFNWMNKNLKTKTDLRLVGALGLSYLEPIVDIKIKGKSRVLYSNVDLKKGRKMLRK